jgi:hypothetical protein
MKKIILFVLSAVVVFFSCKSYKLTHHVTKAILNNKEVFAAFEKYNIYIHDKNNTYYVESPRMAEEGLRGLAHPISDSAVIAKIKQPDSQKEKKKHKFDLNFYTDKAIDNSQIVTANAEKSQLNNSEALKDNIILKSEDIKDITLNAIDKKRGFAKAVGMGLVFIILVLLIILLFVAIGASASHGSSNASGNSSGNSNSGNNSGSSGNGGKGSCYIATMVYGDYEASEVLVLRKFRDEVLNASLAGRMFIKYYYKYSPHFVEKFKNHKKINSIIKMILNKWVNHLSTKKS